MLRMKLNSPMILAVIIIIALLLFFPILIFLKNTRSCIITFAAHCEGHILCMQNPKTGEFKITQPNCTCGEDANTLGSKGWVKTNITDCGITEPIQTFTETSVGNQ